MCRLALTCLIKTQQVTRNIIDSSFISDIPDKEHKTVEVNVEHVLEIRIKQGVFHTSSVKNLCERRHSTIYFKDYSVIVMLVI